MKVKNLLIAGALFAVMLLAGCSSTSSEYTIPLPTVELKKNAAVKITTVGDSAVLGTLAADLGNAFKTNGHKVVDNAADYWVVIYGTKDKRVDNATDNRHNVVYSKTKREHGGGGEEYVTSYHFSTAVEAHFASIVLYDVKTLTPMVNMDFPFYASSRANSASAPALNSTKKIANAFVATMNEILVFNKTTSSK